jgi:outer membrane protein assembly factor BamB
MSIAPLIVALGGRVIGIDQNTGKELWKNEMHGGGLAWVAIAVTDEFVFSSASASKIFCINRRSGENVWSAKTTGMGRATILCTEDHVFISKSGCLDCFNKLDGSQLWGQDLRAAGKGCAALGVTDNVVQADGKSK